MDTNQYIDIFLDESREHLQAVNDQLLKLEDEPQDLGIVNEIFRSAHTLKGMAATMGFEDLAALTHQMENVLDKLRHGELAVTADVIDITFEAVESLEEMVNAISLGGDGRKDVSNIVHHLEQLDIPTSNKSSTTRVLKVELDQYQSTVIRQGEESGHSAIQVTVKLNDDCVLKAARAYMIFEALEKVGEVIKTTPPVEEIEEGHFESEFAIVILTKDNQETIKNSILDISEVHNVTISPLNIKPDQAQEAVHDDKQNSNSLVDDTKQSSIAKNSSSKTIRVNTERIDQLMNLFEELVIDRGRLEDAAKRIDDTELIDMVEHLSRVSQDMQDMMLKMRMVPVEQVFNRFPRMVRGLAKDLDKQINLEIIGAETEIDRTVIDEIGDPLVHLIRNSIDHGIESPTVREQFGKSLEGTLTLRAYHSGNHVFVEIEDDGAGINREKVIKKAIENGLITLEQSHNLADEEVYQLIFASGFSTAEQISDISGRGVGLDVVKNKIESLGGEISIQSEQGRGSRFYIQLPLTLSILSTLLVQIQEEIYAIPLSSIMETALLSKENILTAHGKKVIDFRGRVVPLIFLKEIFKFPVHTKESEQEQYAIVIIKKGEEMAGLVVDHFLGKKEVVLKSLCDYLRNVFAISGATILGNGQVSLIIDTNVLVK